MPYFNKIIILKYSKMFSTIIIIVCFINIAISTSYFFLSAFIAIRKNYTYKNSHNAYNLLTFLIWPLYFILHTIAAYYSLYDIMIRPFYWSKTDHGISKIKVN
ncbi:MAG TPA: hypothetical protein QKA14_01220 [Candidatus Megaira endosymbiont of Hartmannula sinica]|nr:hypothetical protein [Candidatus Megaera endosymbiont of Hartmannula sinica]